ncbi:hypothetical protein EVAR_53969_1 [Eumeta japonica]|uniref:RNase H type-1 domain-containing protein n=1 Tax=Eumeta variegata TaxID=151549 RepID=A0A4C1XX64_EUMVA|nr:hypothetical protein EVAR_53969_1 [Eumeta japonica]
MGNERADELARNAALKKKTVVDYDRFPLSFAKKAIRAASLEKWQKRYTEGSTGPNNQGLLSPSKRGVQNPHMSPNDEFEMNFSAKPYGTRRIRSVS